MAAGRKVLEANDHSGAVMVNNWAGVCIAFFTQNSSYGNIWKAGQPYVEHCCGLMADLGFIPLVLWHPSTALIVL
jgi:hypothetical protein